MLRVIITVCTAAYVILLGSHSGYVLRRGIYRSYIPRHKTYDLVKYTLLNFAQITA